MKLSVEHLEYRYKHVQALRGVTLHFAPGITAIVGPNGAGKSTLIKCMAGVLTGQGTVRYADAVIDHSHDNLHTHTISYLPQGMNSDVGITVVETVLLGLLHTLPLRVDDQHLDKVMAILSELDLADLASRNLHELSGGQQQMVWVAQALVKDPEVIMLDEPLNSLDIHHQLELLALIRELTSRKQLITLVALHDLNQAMRYADEVVVLHRGAVYSTGAPTSVITAQMIHDVYQVDANIIHLSDAMPIVHLKGPTRATYSKF